MAITIGHTTFDRATYDDEPDVLYLHVGDPSSAVDFDESPEGRALRFDAAGKLVGISIVNARWLLARSGRLSITVPELVEVESAMLARAIPTA